MKLIIAGSRQLPIGQYDIERFLSFFNLYPSIIVTGACKSGADSAAKWFCGNNAHIPLEEFSAEWEKYGKIAGPIRNKKMAIYSDSLLLIWDGQSKGSKNMKEEMLNLKKPVYEIILRSYNDPK